MNTKKHAITQFELSKVTLRNLNKFELSPTGKLVLMAIVDFYPNIYPAQQTLADTLGIGLSSVKRALKELRGQMLLIAKPDTKYSSLNYKFTSNFFAIVKLTPAPVQNGTSDSVKMNHKQTSEKTNKKDFYKNEGVTYLHLKASNHQIDEKTPLTDKETAIKWIKELTKTTLEMKPIRKMLDEVILKHDFKTATLADLNSLLCSRIKYSSEI